MERLWARMELEEGWRGRLRSLRTGTRIVACLVVAGVVALAVALLLLRSDFPVYPRPLLIGGLAALFLFLALSVRLFLWPLQEREPGPGALVLWIALALGMPVLFALLPEAHGHVHEHPESFEGRGADFWPRAAGCLLFGLATSSPLLGLALLADRRDRLDGRRAVLAAAAAGITGNLTLLLHCPLVSRAHLVTGHASVGFVLAILLWVVVWLRSRRSAARQPAGKM